MILSRLLDCWGCGRSKISDFVPFPIVCLQIPGPQPRHDPAFSLCLGTAFPPSLTAVHSWFPWWLFSPRRVQKFHGVTVTTFAKKSNEVDLLLADRNSLHKKRSYIHTWLEAILIPSERDFLESIICEVISKRQDVRISPICQKPSLKLRQPFQKLCRNNSTYAPNTI